MTLRHPTMRWAPIAGGALLVLLGLACLNYTKAATIEHHREWAREHGMPAPSGTVFWGGALSAMIGAFVIGLSSARRGTAG